MTPSIFAEMLEAHQWANRRLLDKLETLTPEQWTQEVPSSFPSIQATVAHFMTTEQFLLACLTGAPAAWPNPDQLATVAGIRAHWEGIEAGWREAIGALDEAGLQAERSFSAPKGGTYPVKAWWLIQQLLTHAPYHRGQVITMLRQVGGPTVQTDSIRYHITKALS